MALNKDKIFKAADKHIRANRIERAIGEYETWLKENPRDWNTVRQVGDLYHRIGRNDEATKKYALVADHYKRDGFNVRAIATHKMILRLDSSNEEAMRNLAELQAEEGLLMEAKSHYQALVELYTKKGHKRLAAEVFKKLTEIDPQDVRVRHKYAEFLNKQGKADEASVEYVGIADQFIGQGLVDEAIKILERGRSLATDDPELTIKLAHAHTLQGNHSESVRMLEEVRGKHASDPNILGQLGEAYLAAGNNEEAETAFQRLRDTEPDNPDHVIRIVDLRIAQGQLDAALEQLTPLIDLHVADNDSSQAIKLVQKVLSKEPYHIKSLMKLAEVHTILKQDPARVGVYDSLCEAYHRSGDIDRAVQVAEQLVELEPEGSQHKDRLNFLRSKLAVAAADVEPASEAPPPDASDAAAPAVDSPVVDIDLDVDASEDYDAELTLEEDSEEASPPAPPSSPTPVLTPPPMPAPPTPVSAEASSGPDLGEVIELTSEDEENVKEKLTEAEVFVRYGLVDKAIAQLLDVLESFRFHVEAREKLIEVYRDQGLTREASEQLVQLGQVFDKLNRPEDASTSREDAAQLNPDLAAQAASAELAAQDELELTLSPETDSDLGDVGIEMEAPPAAPLDPSSPEVRELPPIDDDLDVLIDDESFRIEGDEEEEPLEISFEESSESLGPDSSGDVEMSDEDIVLEGVPDLDADLEPALAEVALHDTEDDADVEEIAISLDDVDEKVDHEEKISVDSTLHLDDASAEDLELSIDDDAESLAMDLGDTDADSTIPLTDAGLSDAFSAESSSEDLAVDLDDEEFPVDFPTELDDDTLGGDTLEVADLEDSAEDIAPVIELEIPRIELDSEPDVSAVAAVPMSDAMDLSLLDDVAESVPEAPPSEPPPAVAPLAAELEEVDEFIALGLYEDARDSLRDLSQHHPEDESVRAKVAELGFSFEPAAPSDEGEEEAARTSFVGRVLDVAEPVLEESADLHAALDFPPVEPTHAGSTGSLDETEDIQSLVDSSTAIVVDSPGSDDPEDAFIDLATELSDEIFGTHSATGDDIDESEGPLTDPGLDQIFKEFRKGVEKQLGTEDYDTRYNLGIAYKEMGLLDEAIAEFQLAAKDEVRGLECCSMLGLCFLEKGMPELAIKWFTKGLELPGRREEEYHGLQYDLGQAHEAAGRPEQALELYMEIYNDNARFRDVTDRVRDLQAAVRK